MSCRTSAAVTATVDVHVHVVDCGRRFVSEELAIRISVSSSRRCQNDGPEAVCFALSSSGCATSELSLLYLFPARVMWQIMPPMAAAGRPVAGPSGRLVVVDVWRRCGGEYAAGAVVVVEVDAASGLLLLAGLCSDC